jgi:Ni/Co efflux regulator RcnB
MLAVVLKRLLLTLTAVAFLGGPVAQAMALAQAMSTAAPQNSMINAMTTAADCEKMGMATHGKSGNGSMPCQSANFDCIQEMGCFSSAVSLATASPTLSTPFAYSRSSYRLRSGMLTSESPPLEPFPPKNLA